MGTSSFQIERLIDRLRRLGRWLGWPAPGPRAESDPVQAGTAARTAARLRALREELTGRGGRPPQPSLNAVREDERYPPRTESERERRAGSFMRPPYTPEPAPPIPKAPAKPVRRPRTRPLADG